MCIFDMLNEFCINNVFLVHVESLQVKLFLHVECSCGCNCLREMFLSAMMLSMSTMLANTFENVICLKCRMSWRYWVIFSIISLVLDPTYMWPIMLNTIPHIQHFRSKKLMFWRAFTNMFNISAQKTKRDLFLFTWFFSAERFNMYPNLSAKIMHHVPTRFFFQQSNSICGTCFTRKNSIWKY